MTTATDYLLKVTLSVAVPLRIAELERAITNGSTTVEEIIKEAKEQIGPVASESDKLLFGSSKRGEAARVFNSLVKALAAMAFVPGGVTFSGLHFEAKGRGE
jgi:hypothetical protein